MSNRKATTVPAITLAQRAENINSLLTTLETNYDTLATEVKAAREECARQKLSWGKWCDENIRINGRADTRQRIHQLAQGEAHREKDAKAHKRFREKDVNDVIDANSP
ncbi:MAG: hypothetical protein JO188_18190 [Hyphomicrobiales bacterium]|nr:hypothetical protein [Hyphomicrobiales bacterium]